MTAPRESYLLDLLGVRSILDDDGEYYPSVSTLEYGTGFTVAVSEEGKRVRVSTEVTETDVEAALDDAKAYVDAAVGAHDIEAVLQAGSDANGGSISDLAHLGLVAPDSETPAWTLSNGSASVQGYVGSNAPGFSANAGDTYYRANGSTWVCNGGTAWRPLMQLLATSSAVGGIPFLNSGSLGRFQTRDDLKYDAGLRRIQILGSESHTAVGYSLRSSGDELRGNWEYRESTNQVRLYADPAVSGAHIVGDWEVPSGSTLTVQEPSESGHAARLADVAAAQAAATSYTDSVVASQATQVLGDVPYDLSGATYDSVSYGPTANMYGGCFSADGSKLYLLVSDERVYQYTLSTPWDLTTGSDALLSFDASSEVTEAGQLLLSPDGTRLYIFDTSDDTIHQYTLSTPWNISTASYDSLSYDTTGQITASEGAFAFSADGTKLYLGDRNARVLYQYTLGTAWNISTATYDSVSHSVLAQMSSVAALTLSPNGERLYTASGTEVVYQYTLSTPWDLSTATYDDVSLDASSEFSIIRQLHFSADGTKLFALDRSTGFYQYSTTPRLGLTFAVDGGDAEVDLYAAKSGNMVTITVDVAVENDTTGSSASAERLLPEWARPPHLVETWGSFDVATQILHALSISPSGDVTIHKLKFGSSGLVSDNFGSNESATCTASFVVD